MENTILLVNENICRICLESENQNDLLHPCNCNGNSKYVHKKCLNRWRIENIFNEKFYKCEICNANYILQYSKINILKNIWKFIDFLFSNIITTYLIFLLLPATIILFDIEDINLTYDILFEPYIQIKNLCIIFDITIIIISIYLFLSLIYDIYLIKQYSNYSKFKKIYKIKNIYVLFILVVGYLVLVFLNYLFGYFILLFLINYISKYRYKITSGILYIEIYNNS